MHTVTCTHAIPLPLKHFNLFSPLPQLFNALSLTLAPEHRTLPCLPALLHFTSTCTSYTSPPHILPTLHLHMVMYFLPFLCIGSQYPFIVQCLSSPLPHPLPPTQPVSCKTYVTAHCSRKYCCLQLFTRGSIMENLLT